MSVGFWAAVGTAVFCGAIVGFERQLYKKPAGIRTSILICLGTTVFVQLGKLTAVNGGDPSRVVAASSRTRCWCIAVQKKRSSCS